MSMVNDNNNNRRRRRENIAKKAESVVGALGLFYISHSFDRLVCAFLQY